MIKTEIRQQKAFLQIDRPQQKNALSASILSKLIQILNDLEQDTNVKAVIIYGEPNFSSGGDLNDMLIDTFEESLDMAKEIQKIYSQIANIKKPIIAYTKGVVFGGGLELALVCDFILSDSNAQFALPETALGIVPGGGATQRIKQRIGKQNAAYMLMTGKRFSAKKMLETGLIQEIVTDIKDVEKIVNRVIQNNTTATQEIKKLLALDNNFETESESFAKLLQTEGKTLIKAFTDKK